MAAGQDTAEQRWIARDAWRQRLTCAWPGLTRVWRQGDWASLRTAVIFTLLLNLAIAGTFIWPWRFPTVLVNMLWVAVALMWTVCFAHTWRHFPEFVKEKVTIEQDLFLCAQTEYLRGDWYAAEAALERLLRVTPQDVDARLLLATVYRRTGRFELARKQLRRLARTGAAKWGLEIRRELELLDRQTPSTDTAASEEDPIDRQPLQPTHATNSTIAS